MKIIEDSCDNLERNEFGIPILPSDSITSISNGNLDATVYLPHCAKEIAGLLKWSGELWGHS